MSSELRFNDIEFEVVDFSGVPWLRGYQIGTALGYASQPDAAIRKIFDRNADEFTSDMTALVELQTAGGKQQVRIFSPRGCWLIGMFARTAKAKAFRRWVLDVLEREARGPAPKGDTAEAAPELPPVDTRPILVSLSDMEADLVLLNGNRTFFANMAKVLHDMELVAQTHGTPVQAMASIMYPIAGQCGDILGKIEQGLLDVRTRTLAAVETARRMPRPITSEEREAKRHAANVRWDKERAKKESGVRHRKRLPGRTGAGA